jgi:hypothetical protein
MKWSPLTEEESVNGYTHRVDFSWKDFNGVTIGANTDKTFTGPGVVAGDELFSAHLHLTTAFKDSADTAFNDIALDFGDNGSATRFFSGVQINENGTEVIDSELDPSSVYIYTAAGNLKLNFNSMSAKDLTNVNTGKGWIKFGIRRNSALLDNPGP